VTSVLSLGAHFVGLACRQGCAAQTLPRQPERQAVSDDPEALCQYDQAPASRLALTYACGLEILHRARPSTRGRAALDLACGPGHFTLDLARHLGCQDVLGVDLSPAMLDAARRNAAAAGLADRVRFHAGDVRDLRGLPEGRFDLCTFTNGAHHLPDLATLAGVLEQMDHRTRPDGLVMVLDLARLRTGVLSDRYAEVVAGDYVCRGLPRLREEFRQSLRAAWTIEEMRRAIPKQTRRVWCHLVPAGLPTVQVVLGLPWGRHRPFVRGGSPWHPGAAPVPADMRLEWALLRWSLRLGRRYTGGTERCWR
jgi:ubiquinone/menaquinone biosynthesis C-methylase UbiE